MVCHVLRLETECGACGRPVPLGRVLITDQIEPPVYVVVCEGCTSGLDGARVAATLRDTTPTVSGPKYADLADSPDPTT